jgi:hypothetical protein
MNWILFISSKISRFKVDAFNGVYEVNIDTSFKNLNKVKSCTQLDASILNPDRNGSGSGCSQTLLSRAFFL